MESSIQNVLSLQSIKGYKTMLDANSQMQDELIDALSTVQQLEVTLNRFTATFDDDDSDDEIELRQLNASMSNSQQQASLLYDSLDNDRQELIARLSNGLAQIDQIQPQLIDRLNEWKLRQKYAQTGAPFVDAESQLNAIQIEFEILAEQNHQLQSNACLLFDLLKCGPQLEDNRAQEYMHRLGKLINQLRRLQSKLVSDEQPPSVINLRQPFAVKIRLLFGKKLDIKYPMANTIVRTKIITENDARLLMSGRILEEKIQSVSTILGNNKESTMILTMDKKSGHLSSEFMDKTLMMFDQKSFTSDQKYALLFHVGPYELNKLDKFDVVALSLPFMIAANESEECNAHSLMLWQRAFGSMNRDEAITEAVPWQELAIVLKNAFRQITGAQRQLADSDLAYLGERLSIDSTAMVTFDRFAKQKLSAGVNFSFWQWFYANMKLIEHKLLKFWDEGWLIGFIDKETASTKMLAESRWSTFMLRFSDSLTGAVCIGLLGRTSEGNRTVHFITPFTIDDLGQLSLAQRISSCPQIQKIRYLYPDIDKAEMLRNCADDMKAQVKKKGGYITPEIIMDVRCEEFASSSNAASSSSTIDDSIGSIVITDKIERKSSDAPRSDTDDYSDSSSSMKK